MFFFAGGYIHFLGEASAYDVCMYGCDRMRKTVYCSLAIEGDDKYMNFISLCFLRGLDETK